ncbi:MAG: hypothetical protein ACR2QH_06690 [Geminicoccaceae bacterium]
MPARDKRNRALVGCGLKAAAFPSGFGIVTAEPPMPKPRQPTTSPILALAAAGG